MKKSRFAPEERISAKVIFFGGSIPHDSADWGR
jgi:hypothetical protein